MSHQIDLIHWVLAFVFAVGSFQCKLVRSQSPLTEAQVAGLRRYVQDEMQGAQIPGIAISIARGREILWEEGFGFADRENQILATPQTPFYMASVTKAFTGTAVMMLADRHKLNLDHPINEYLGFAEVHSPMWNVDEATVRRVATHTAGLTTYNRTCAVEDSQCLASTEAAIQHYGILFWPPGDHFDYSNLGYGMLGAAVSHISGESFADFLHAQVFQPLGMSNCFLGNEGGAASQMAAQYNSSTHVRTPIEVSDTPGASSAHCSVHDLALFGMFALGERAPHQKQILSDASLKLMRDPTVDEGAGERYGFGWSLQPNHHGYLTIFSQGGTNDSFAMLELVPSEQIAIGITANTGTLIPFKILNAVLSDMLPRYGEALASETTAPPRHEQTPDKPDGLIGRWVGSLQTWKGGIPLEIEISQSHQVQAKWAGGSPMEAAHVHIADPKFTCVISGQLNTPEAPVAPTGIELELYLREGELVGAGTTSGAAQLPYWVQLKKSTTPTNKR